MSIRTHEQFMADMQPIFDRMAGGPMNNHTPGPWVSDCEYGDAGVRYRVIRNERYEEIIGMNGNVRDTDEALICAAPDLLRGCELAMAAFERGYAIDWDEIAAAIAKAKGETK